MVIKPFVAVSHTRWLFIIFSLILFSPGISQEVSEKPLPTASLHQVVRAGNLAQVRKLIDRGCDVNAKDSIHFTALHYAAFYDHKEIAEALLCSGARVYTRNPKSMEPLEIAAREGSLGVMGVFLAKLKSVERRDGDQLLKLAAERGHRQMVELLVAAKAPVNPKGSSYQPVLHVAAKHGHSDIVRFLITQRAQVNAVSDWGKESPLHFAVANDHKEVAELLLANGADIHAQDRHGRTPLHFAQSRAMAEMLIAKGAKVDVEAWADREVKQLGTSDSDGQAPLHTAAAAGHRGAAEVFIEKGADIEAKALRPHCPPGTKADVTPLLLAVSSGHADVVKLLVAKGADFKKRDWRRRTLLHIAAEEGHKEVAKVLIGNGLDVNVRAPDKQTPLHLAKNLDVVKFLVENGADIQACDKTGKTPLHVALQYGREDIAEYLLSRDEVDIRSAIYKTLLHSAMGRRNSKEIFELLLANSADIDVNVRNKNGTTLLFSAVSSGRIDLAKLLIDRGADAKVSNDSGWTPLHYADSKEAVELLLLHGADVNAVSKAASWTPLHHANREDVEKALIANGADVKTVTKHGLTPLHCTYHKAVAELLVAGGADVNARDERNRTPLHFTFLTDYHRDMVGNISIAGMAELLLSHRADVNAKDNNGNTPLHVVDMLDDRDLVMVLLKHGADVNAINNKGQKPRYDARLPEYIEFISQKRTDYTQGRSKELSQQLGNRLLKESATGSMYEVINLLREGADVNIQDREGMSPLHHAAHRNRPDNVALLLKCGADIDSRDMTGKAPLHYGAINEKTAKCLLDHGADVNVRDKDKKTPLHYASNKESIELLLGRGAELNARDNKGNTPLHELAHRGYGQAVEALLVKGADINTKNIAGKTPLHLAFNNEIVTLALAHGADVNARGNHGETPLHDIIICMSPDFGMRLVPTLVESGADINAQTRDGLTPLQVAVYYGDREVIEYLSGLGN